MVKLLKKDWRGNKTFTSFAYAVLYTVVGLWLMFIQVTNPFDNHTGFTAGIVAALMGLNAGIYWFLWWKYDR